MAFTAEFLKLDQPKKFLAVATSEDDGVVSSCSQISVLSRQPVGNNALRTGTLRNETNL